MSKGGTPLEHLARRFRARPYWTAVVVALVAVALRVPAIGYGLPNVWHPDEPTNVGVGARMVDHNSWSPHFFAYPSFLFYVITLVGHLQRALGRWHVGAGLQSQAIGISHTSDPHLFLALRSITAAFSVALCVVVWTACYVVTKSWLASSVAGLLLAVSPLMVTIGVFVTPDTYAAFFTALAVLFAISVLRRGKLIDYVLGGAAVGFAAGSKYNAVVVAVAIVVAHFLGSRRSELVLLFASACASIIGFLVTTPGALFDTHKFFSDALAQARMYSTGHSGYQGSSFSYYLQIYLHQGWICLAFAISGILGLAGPWWRETTVMLTFNVSYVVLISVQVVHFDRDFLPAMVGLSLLGGIGFASVVRLCTLDDRRAARFAPVGLTVIFGAAALFPIRSAANVPLGLNEYPRTEAQTWIYQHLPQGSVVVDEDYGPWIDRARYRVTEVGSVLTVSSSKIPATSAAVVVTDQGSGRYLSDPARYPGNIEEYRQLSARYCTGALFSNGPWIRIFVPCPATGGTKA